MLRAAFRPVCRCSITSTRASYHTRRTKLPIVEPVQGTYQDILKLHEKIDECVYERDELRELTLPLQVQDNRLRARFKEENWKLREFDEWIARQDPNWQPPPRLPHGRKKRNKRLREMAQAEAAEQRRLAKEAREAEGAAEGAPLEQGAQSTSENTPSSGMEPRFATPASNATASAL